MIAAASTHITPATARQCSRTLQQQRERDLWDRKRDQDQDQTESGPSAASKRRTQRSPPRGVMPTRSPPAKGRAVERMATTSWCSTRCSIPYRRNMRWVLLYIMYIVGYLNAAFPFAGPWVLGPRHLWPGGQVLEARHLRDRGHQDPEKPSFVCAAGPDRGIDPFAPQPGECRRVQFCAGLWVLSAQEPHLPGLWDAGAEPLRFSQAEQVFAAAAQVHKAHSGAGESQLLKSHRNSATNSVLHILGIDCPVEAETTGSDPCRPKAREHHAGGPSTSALPRQGDRLW